MAEIWILLVAVSVLVEIITNAYLGLFVGLGALLGFLAALLGQSLLIQLVLVLGVSAAGIFLVRPLALAELRQARPSRPSASEPPGRPERVARLRATPPARASAPERLGVVESYVGDENHPGSVIVDGRLFRAVTTWPRDLPDGTQVVVRAARGGTLWVEPY